MNRRTFAKRFAFTASGLLIPKICFPQIIVRGPKLNGAKVGVVNTPSGGGGLIAVVSNTGTSRDGFNGFFAGYSFTVGTGGITMTDLGCIILPSNSGTRNIYILNGVTLAQLSTTAINMSLGSTGNNLYNHLGSSVNLPAGTYYALADSITGQNEFDGGTATPGTNITITASVFTASLASTPTNETVGSHVIVYPNFLYTNP